MPKKTNNLPVIGALLLSACSYASAAAAESTFSNQLEMLEWSDPERAAQIIDAAPPLAAGSGTSEIDMLEIRAMIFADGSREEDVAAIEQRLDVIASAGGTAALRAGKTNQRFEDDKKKKEYEYR